MPVFIQQIDHLLKIHPNLHAMVLEPRLKYSLGRVYVQIFQISLRMT